MIMSYISGPSSYRFSNPVANPGRPQLPVISPRFAMQSLFSDNSIVCYKLHSLPSCPVGTVRNARSVGIRT